MTQGSGDLVQQAQKSIQDRDGVRRAAGDVEVNRNRGGTPLFWSGRPA
jgi:hypothetical protein